ncbi:hypothetical protein [Haloactinospora alba]|uniref:hypothetical protein n=1 Tax=Haloactinospora alba TaxID=405555 RepID=UPI00114FD752|nr:hypothetical protein [Haloactinospora alba]
MRTVVPPRERAGTRTDRVAACVTDSGTRTASNGTGHGTRHHVRLLQRADGHTYTRKEDGASSPV